MAAVRFPKAEVVVLFQRAFSHIPPLSFTGVCKIWPRTSTSLSFRNEVAYLYQNSKFGAAMMDLCSFQIWCSLVHPH